MFGLIKRNFKYLTIPTFILLYISMVRSHLDSCSSVWAPYRNETLKPWKRSRKEQQKFYQDWKIFLTVKDWKFVRHQPYTIDV